MKNLGVSLTRLGKMERELDRQIGPASAVMVGAVLDHCGEEVVEPEGKALIYQPINVTTLTYGHERSERMRL